MIHENLYCTILVAQQYKQYNNRTMEEKHPIYLKKLITLNTNAKLMQATLVYRINTKTMYTAGTIYVLSKINISNMAGNGNR